MLFFSTLLFTLASFPASILCLGTMNGPGMGTGYVSLAVALLALTAMEIVLGIDNIVFISIATGKLPEEQQNKARLIGLSLAMGMRILLLCFIAMVASWTHPLFSLDSILPTFVDETIKEHPEINEISVRDLILLVGGLFLIYQSVKEIHSLIENRDDELDITIKHPSFGSVIFQIMMLDIVFSLDSVITAVGMVSNIYVMIAAVIMAVLVMMIFSASISNFVLKHPSVKMLALSFLLMIGVMLLAEGFGSHFNKNYVYFAMAFSLFVEILNLRARAKRRQLAASRKATSTSTSASIT